MRNRVAEFFNPKINVCSLWNCPATLYSNWHISFPCLWAAILDFWLLLALHSMGNNFIEFIHLGNMSCHWNFATCMLYSGWNISISGLWAAILEFVLRLHHTVCEIASLNFSRAWVRAAWGKFNELAPVLTKGVSLWNWMEKYMMPVFRECWYMLSRRGLWMRRTWIGWGDDGTNDGHVECR